MLRGRYDGPKVPPREQLVEVLRAPHGRDNVREGPGVLRWRRPRRKLVCILLSARCQVLPGVWLWVWFLLFKQYHMLQRLQYFDLLFPR